MCKGKFLKDNSKKLFEYKIKEGSKITLMGKPEDKTIDLQKITEEQKEVFMENLTPEERAKYFKNVLGEVLAVGLVNLGNTCYMNSCM